MAKRIFIITIIGLLSAYFVIALVYSNSDANEETVCTDLRIKIMDKLENQYIKEKDIERVLQKAGLELVGKNLSEINTGKVEAVLEESNMIKQAECYKTAGGALHLNIYQRVPILRIIANDGSYYVDNEGKRMPVPDNFSAYVPVATGYIDEDFARNELYNFTLFLQKNKFWNAQVEQIYVDPNKDIELTPRVGNHQIILGKIEDCEENLDKLTLFYEKGLNKVGWNKYSKINLKYKNQVVCTKI